MNIAVLISGGVDSAVVVHQLCEQGYKPDLHYIKIGMEGEDSSCTAEEDIELSRATARHYGLSLEVTDLQKEYWDMVVGYAIERVQKGLTPNPDVMCNRFIKFGAFEQRIGHSYDKVATGHYATNVERDGLMWLGTAKDPVKDQTDFLSQLSYSQLSHTIFPIGHLMKEEVRRIALEARLPSARRKDSQGICFLGKINYNDFLRKFLGEKEGKVIDIETGKVVGTHQGFWFHTIGQRKGLGLGGGPWFVVKKNIRKNIVFVAHGWDTQLQYGHDFRLADISLPKIPGRIHSRCLYASRYGTWAASCRAHSPSMPRAITSIARLLSRASRPGSSAASTMLLPASAMEVAKSVFSGNGERGGASSLSPFMATGDWW